MALAACSVEIGVYVCRSFKAVGDENGDGTADLCCLKRLLVIGFCDPLPLALSTAIMLMGMFDKLCALHPDVGSGLADRKSQDAKLKTYPLSRQT